MMRIIPATFVVAAVLLGAQPAAATTISITSATLAADAATLDFNSAPTGAISGTDPLFTNFGLSLVSLVGTFAAMGDELDTSTAGNALGPQSNSLHVLGFNQPLDYASANSGLRFDLAGTARQFGFRLVDQASETLRFQTFLNGSMTNNVTFSVSAGAIRYFQTDTAFDRLQIMTDTGGTGWALDDITLADRTSVPEPASICLMGAALVAILVQRVRR